MAEILLEIIDPSGQIILHPLIPGGVTRIGGSQDNDIIIDGPGVADYHLEISHYQHPYHVVALSYYGVTLNGRPIPPNVPMALSDVEIMQAGDYEFILLGNEVAEEDGIGDTPQNVSSVASTPPPPMSTPQPRTVQPTPPPPVSQGSTTRPATVFPGAVAAGQGDYLAHSSSFDLINVFSTRPRDTQHEYIILELIDMPDSSSVLHIDTGEEINFRIRITNNGHLVAYFRLELQGVGWYTLAAPEVRLLPGQTENLPIKIQPPRSPSCRAGTYHFAVVVTSPDYDNAASQLGATLIIEPYYKHEVVSLTPNEQQAKDKAHLNLTIYNMGNSPATFHLEGRDNKNDCNVEFMVMEGIYHLSPAEIVIEPSNTDNQRLLPGGDSGQSLQLSPGQAIVPIRVTVPDRPTVWSSRSHTINITTQSVDGQQGSITLSSRVGQKPIFNKLAVLTGILLIFLSICGCNLYLFRPVGSFLADGAVQDKTINTGTEVALEWYTDPWRFASIRIDPTIGPVPDAAGIKMVKPAHTEKYEIQIQTWTSQLVPFVYNNLGEKSITVYVTPVPPGINAFTTNREEIVLIEGENNEAILSWDVQLADELILTDETGSINRFLDNLQGDVPMRPEQRTVYFLVANNEYVQTPIRSAPVVVNVVTPTPTPTSTPVPVVLEYFNVQPNNVELGSSVVVLWKVSGVESVSIDQIGASLPPQGQIDHTPQETGLINYILSAAGFKGDEIGTIATVTVVPPTATVTPTSTPEAPVIVLFSGNPQEIVKAEDNPVELNWSVDGATTNIELSSPALGAPIPNLAANGNFTLNVGDTAQFILTAFNFDAKTSAVIEIKGIDATETPEPPTAVPPTETPLPTPMIEFFRAESGTGTASGDVRPIGGNEYEVVVGSNVKFSWSVQFASEVKLLAGSQDFGSHPFAGDFTDPNVTQSRTYELRASNSAGDTVRAFIKIIVQPKNIPGPVNFRGRVTDVDGTLLHELSWNYAAASETDIFGFRIYRGISLPYQLVADESELVSSIRKWVDPEEPVTCQKYYIVAVYLDIITNQVVETDSSNGWSGAAC